MTYELFSLLNAFLFLSLLLLILSIFREKYEKFFVGTVVFSFLYLVFVQVLYWRETFVAFGNYVIRFYPPFWIENEKLFFWFFLSAVLLLKVREGKEFSKIALLIMLLFVIFVQNPSNPLPNLRRELELFNPAYIDYYAARAAYFYNSPYMWIHPPLLFLAYAYLLHSFALSLAKKNEYDFAKNGYLFLTLGLIFGYPWAIIAWGENWWWDPKIAMSIMLWVIYTAYLHARIGGKFYREINLAGFGSLVATYLMTYLLPGVHGYG
ncbi:cytochrome c assembly protein [Ferroglobus placidus DSM 10642]|uniref:Cytochrome c assembly protein n=1 Tax=Ferroglobus placidus (strain DSM 10642 / AEDII12DO) TaxID=589924 RepID=D3RYI0_FERPA|nr:cytochrome c biogenesis protein CcsA [Ferroglobus placidus]ADC65543.1 cytochrome c assembly protein [Ferroglobus placidus DSM 10642]